MAAKALFVLCASVLVAQSAVGQCLGRVGLGAPFRGYGAYDGGCGCGAYGGYGAAADITAASCLNAAWGGGLGVSSASCVPPSGLNVASDNVYEGTVAVGGNLPFLGTVGVEGVFPSAGSGAISYNCGDGALGITAEAAAPAHAGYNGHGYAGLGYNGLGYNGIGYNGLGYNGLGYNGVGYNGLRYRGYGGHIGGCGCSAVY